MGDPDLTKECNIFYHKNNKHKALSVKGNALCLFYESIAFLMFQLIFFVLKIPGNVV